MRRRLSRATHREPRVRAMGAAELTESLVPQAIDDIPVGHPTNQFRSPHAGAESTTTYVIFNLELQRGGTHGRASRAASALVRLLSASDFPSRSRSGAGLSRQMRPASLSRAAFRVGIPSILLHGGLPTPHTRGSSANEYRLTDAAPHPSHRGLQ